MTSEQDRQPWFFQKILELYMRRFNSVPDEYERNYPRIRLVKPLLMPEPVCTSSPFEVYGLIAVVIVCAVLVLTLLFYLAGARKRRQASLKRLDPSNNLIVDMLEEYIRKRQEELKAVKGLSELCQKLCKDQKQQPKLKSMALLQKLVFQKIVTAKKDILEFQSLEILMAKKLEQQSRHNKTLGKEKGLKPILMRKTQTDAIGIRKLLKPAHPVGGGSLNDANNSVQDFLRFVDDFQTSTSSDVDDQYDENFEEICLVEEMMNSSSC